VDLQKIGACLRELRKEKGLTQEQLAAHFNVSVKTVSRWENGVHMPDIELLLELADFYEVDLRALLRGERVSEKTAPNTKETVQETAEYNKAKTSMRKRIAGEFAYYRTVIKWRIDSLRRKIGHALHRMLRSPKELLKTLLLGILIAFGAVILFQVIRLIVLPRFDSDLSFVYHNHEYEFISGNGRYGTTRDGNSPKKKAVAKLEDAVIYTLKDDPDEFYLSPHVFWLHLPYNLLGRGDMMQPPSVENADHIDVYVGDGKWDTLDETTQRSILKAYSKSTVGPESNQSDRQDPAIIKWKAISDSDYEEYHLRCWYRRPNDLYYDMYAIRCGDTYYMLLEDGETLIAFDGSALQRLSE